MNESYLTVSGNLSTQPEGHTATNGAPFATFRMASNERYRDADGRYVDSHTNFYKIRVWNRLAQNVLASLKKGDPVVVHGKLRVKEFTRKDGIPGLAIEIDGYSVGHNLVQGTTTYTKGPRQVVIEGDRWSDPAVNRERENDWGAPDIEPIDEDGYHEFDPFADADALGDADADSAATGDPGRGLAVV
ncbi:MAG: single-stranded DNA-binding protein [Tetrasphaera sp.]